MLFEIAHYLLYWKLYKNFNMYCQYLITVLSLRCCHEGQMAVVIASQTEGTGMESNPVRIKSDISST